MQIELRPIAAVRPYEANPRVNDAGVQALANIIRRFGFRQPIVVDEDGVIVVGHTRWKAAKLLKLETVPVHVAGDLSAEELTDKLGVDHAQVDEVIAQARRRITVAADYNRDAEIGKAVTRLNDLYARALRSQDARTSLAVQRELNRLLGLFGRRRQMRRNQPTRLRASW